MTKQDTTGQLGIAEHATTLDSVQQQEQHGTTLDTVPQCDRYTWKADRNAWGAMRDL